MQGWRMGLVIPCGKGLVPRRRRVETKFKKVNCSVGPTTTFEAITLGGKKILTYHEIDY